MRVSQLIIISHNVGTPEAEEYRDKFDVVLYEMPKKLGKFLDKLTLTVFM